MPAMQRNPDGSWTEAQPLGWQGPANQVDWEVYRKPISRTWHAYGYNRRTLLREITAHTKLGVWLRARLAYPGRPHTFLWDQK